MVLRKSFLIGIALAVITAVAARRKLGDIAARGNVRPVKPTMDLEATGLENRDHAVQPHVSVGSAARKAKTDMEASEKGVSDDEAKTDMELREETASDKDTMIMSAETMQLESKKTRPGKRGVEWIKKCAQLLWNPGGRGGSKEALCTPSSDGLMPKVLRPASGPQLHGPRPGVSLSEEYTFNIFFYAESGAMQVTTTDDRLPKLRLERPDDFRKIDWNQFPFHLEDLIQGQLGTENVEPEGIAQSNIHHNQILGRPSQKYVTKQFRVVLKMSGSNIPDLAASVEKVFVKHLEREKFKQLPVYSPGGRAENTLDGNYILTRRRLAITSNL